MFDRLNHFMRRTRRLTGAAVLLAWAAVLGWLSQTTAAQRLALPGNPLPGITIEEFERFRLGLEDFVEVEDAAEGLGPAYNGTGCSACHNSPAIGGISPVSEVRAGRLDAEGNFEVLGGGTLFHIFSIPDHSCQPIIPPEANVVTKRVPIPLFGAGLVEAIADETLVALEDPDDLDNDGISGRAARIIDVGTGRARIGRFGWKAQHATLLAFGADAYRNEMGITNDLFVNEVAAGVDPAALELCDLRPDPEDGPEPGTGLRGIDNFESFMKFLAPIERAPLTEQAAWGRGCSTRWDARLATFRSYKPGAKAIRYLTRKRCRSIPTCCSMTRGPETESRKRRPCPTRFAHHHCGVCGYVVRCCTTAAPLTLNRPSWPTARRRNRRVFVSRNFPSKNGPHFWRFWTHCEPGQAGKIPKNPGSHSISTRLVVGSAATEGVMSLQRIDIVSIPVSDQLRSKAFYTEKLVSKCCATTPWDPTNSGLSSVFPGPTLRSRWFIGSPTCRRDVSKDLLLPPTTLTRHTPN